MVAGDGVRQNANSRDLKVLGGSSLESPSLTPTLDPLYPVLILVVRSAQAKRGCFLGFLKGAGREPRLCAGGGY